MGTARPGRGRWRGPDRHSTEATSYNTEKGRENSPGIKDSSVGIALCSKHLLLQGIFTEDVQSSGTPSSHWKASGSGIPFLKGITGYLPSQKTAVGAGSEEEKTRRDRSEELGEHREIPKSEMPCLKDTHFLLAFEQVHWALKVLPAAGRKALVGLT